MSNNLYACHSFVVLSHMVTQNRRAILKTVGSMTVVGGLAGCMGDESQEEDTESNGQETQQEGAESAITEVRVAHLSPDAPNVDIYVSGQQALEDIAFEDVSDYTEFQPGTYSVMVTEAGAEDEVLYEDSLDVETGTYTLTAVGETSGENEPLSVEVFEDDPSDPGDNSRVNVFHAVPDAPAVDIVDEESGDPFIEDLGFGEAQSVETLADDYSLEISPSEGDDPMETFGVSLDAGTIYSAFAVGYLDPADAPTDEPIDLEVVDDASGMS